MVTGCRGQVHWKCSHAGPMDCNLAGACFLQEDSSSALSLEGDLPGGSHFSLPLSLKGVPRMKVGAARDALSQLPATARRRDMFISWVMQGWD
jgi:hypothetical protein